MSFATATWTSLHTHSCHQLHPQVSQNRDLNNFMMELCEVGAIRQMMIPIYLWQETTGFYMGKSHLWGRLIRTKQSLFKRLIFPMDFSLIYHITTRFRTKSNGNRSFFFHFMKNTVAVRILIFMMYRMSRTVFMLQSFQNHEGEFVHKVYDEKKTLQRYVSVTSIFFQYSTFCCIVFLIRIRFI